MVVPHCRHPWFLGTWVEQDILTDGDNANKHRETLKQN
jgi:hypothetical protein